MLHPFEEGIQKVIPGVLVYVERQGKLLMIHRNRKPGDDHWGKWNGLGGKLDLGESPWQAARRELHEEAGLEFPEDAFKLLGMLQFPNFKPHKRQDWWVSVFWVDGSLAPGKITHECDEGTLAWVTRGEVMGLSLWEGDALFLPFVLEKRPFFGTIWYEGGKVARHRIEVLDDLARDHRGRPGGGARC